MLIAPTALIAGRGHCLDGSLPAGSGLPPINARAETLLTKPAFADAMRRGHRCLVPVSGFFEFKATPEGKQPT